MRGAVLYRYHALARKREREHALQHVFGRFRLTCVIFKLEKGSRDTIRALWSSMAIDAINP